MQAIILSAGHSSRCIPFKNKSLIKLRGKTLIEHTVYSLINSGIKDIIIVINKDNGIKEALGKNGKIKAFNIKYVEQPGALGMGDALLRTEKYLKNDFFVLSPYHFDFPEFKKLMEKKKRERNIVLLAKKGDILDRYGSIKTDGDKVIDIIEKPKKGEALSNLRIIGIYLLNKNFIDTLKITPSKHYQFEEAISKFAKKEDASFVLTNKETVSLKYSWDILCTKNYMLKNTKRYISKKAKISKTAQILGNVYIEDGVKIMDKTLIKGPCYLGKNSFIGDSAVLRDGVDLGENSVIGAFAEVKDSIVMQDSKVHSGFIGDSIIGKNCRIGAQFCTANKRIDRDTVKVKIKDKKVDTGLKSLGALIGNNVHIGIKSSTMPGIIIENDSIVGPSTTVLNNIPSGTKYYTKFQEIVVKKNE